MTYTVAYINSRGERVGGGKAKTFSSKKAAREHAKEMGAGPFPIAGKWVVVHSDAQS